MISGFRDGAGIAVWMSLGMFFGYGSIWLTIGLCVGLLMIYCLGRKIHSEFQNDEIITITDIIRLKIGTKVSKLSSIIILITAFLYAGSQLYISGNLLSIFTGIDYQWGLIICAIITGLYTSVGGYKSVIQTDKFQWLIIILICILPFFYPSGQDVSASINQILDLHYSYILGFFGISFFVVITSADVWQRYISSKSAKTFKYATFLSMFIYVLLSVAIISCALVMKSYVLDINSHNILFDFLNLNIQNNLLFAFL